MHYVGISVQCRTKFCFSLSIFIVFTLEMAACRWRLVNVPQTKVVIFHFRSEYINGMVKKKKPNI